MADTPESIPIPVVRSPTAPITPILRTAKSLSPDRMCPNFGISDSFLLRNSDAKITGTQYKKIMAVKTS